MADAKALVGRWVEMREEGGDGRVVLRADAPDLPPARGRRSIEFAEGGTVLLRTPGPDDRSRASDGSWSLDGERLTIDAPGWSGTYRIEQQEKNRVVLSPG